MSAAPATAAERQRARRERKRQGVAVLQVEVDFVALTEMLVERGLLDAMECENREAASAALAYLLRELSHA